MAAFEYVVLDPNGKENKGVMEADSARQLRQQLRDQGLMPLKVEPASERRNRGNESRVGFDFSRRLSALDRVLFTRQLATLIESSLPIEEALAAVAQQTEKQHVSALIMGIRSKVLEGHSLASSLREYPQSFSELYCSSVAAGEQSGYLDRVLDNLADYLDRQFESTRNVEMALFYPVALLIFAFAIVAALMIYVVPDMIGVIQDTGQSLPWFTVVLIAMTDGLRAYWWALLGGAIALVLLVRWGLRQPTTIRLAWDRRKFSLPLVKRISRSNNAGALCKHPEHSHRRRRAAGGGHEHRQRRGFQYLLEASPEGGDTDRQRGTQPAGEPRAGGSVPPRCCCTWWAVASRAVNWTACWAGWRRISRRR